MALIEHHAVVRDMHVALVSLSLGMFALRGLGVLLGAAWPMRTGLRVAVIVVDTALLIAGSLLWVMLGLNPGRDTWLGSSWACWWCMCCSALGRCGVAAARLRVRWPTSPRWPARRRWWQSRCRIGRRGPGKTAANPRSQRRVSRTVR